MYLEALDLGIDEQYDVPILHSELGQKYISLNNLKEAIELYLEADPMDIALTGDQYKISELAL